MQAGVYAKSVHMMELDLLLKKRWVIVLDKSGTHSNIPDKQSYFSLEALLSESCFGKETQIIIFWLYTSYWTKQVSYNTLKRTLLYWLIVRVVIYALNIEWNWRLSFMKKYEFQLWNLFRFKEYWRERLFTERAEVVKQSRVYWDLQTKYLIGYWWIILNVAAGTGNLNPLFQILP